MNANPAGEHTRTVSLQRRITSFFTAGMVIVGLVISAVAITPLYLELSKAVGKKLQAHAKINALLVEENLAGMKAVAQQITSRTRARTLLESLNAGKIGVDEYQAQSKPILLDALDKSEVLLGIARLNAANEKVLSVGYDLPEEFWLIPDAKSELVIEGPISIDGENHIVIGTPILGRSGERVGTDIALFDLDLLGEIVIDYKGLMDTGEVILGKRTAEAGQIFYPLRGASNTGQLSFGHEHPISKALAKAEENESGVASYELSDTAVEIAFAPIHGSDWSVLVKMDSSEAQRDLNILLLEVAAALLGLILLGVLGMHRVLKPLSGRIILRESELHQEVERKTERLQKANRALEKFTYAASHDLKSPLRVIDNAAKWLVEDLEPHFNDDTRKNMALLMGRIKRMEVLLEDLLIYGRIGRVENKLFQLKTTGKGVLFDVLQRLKLPATFDVSVSSVFESMPVMQMPFETVLKIIVENAYAHHDRDTGNITLDAREEADSYVVSIKDDGPGVESQYQEKIFEIFQKLQSRDKVEGSGMGLAIVSRILDVYGGRVEVKSDGRGSEFILHWPKIEFND